jgi:hypothetical protein
MDSAGASASTLAETGRTRPLGQAVFGPCLTEDMNAASLVATLNAWGSARDRELESLRADLLTTQAVVEMNFEQAQAGVSATLLAIINAFRTEAGMMQQQAGHEAAQSLARLELVVTEARTRFDLQDVRFTAGLGELAQRLQIVDAWAQAEPARVAAMMHAAPAPLPPVPSTPPGVGRLGSPGHAADSSWAAYAARQGPAPADAWAGATLGQPTPPLNFGIATPLGFDGGGGRNGSRPEVRDLRINTRDWGAGQHKLDFNTTFDGFQIWKDRAVTFLSKERPDVRSLLRWAETQTKDQLETNLVEQASRLGVVDLAAVEYAVHDGIQTIVLDSLLQRARNCAGRGCEFWRALHAEWHGAAPQLRDAKARRFMEPPRCKDINELWSRLPAWERLGEEVENTDFKLPEWMRNLSLEKLIPAQLLNTLISRTDIVGYPMRLAWVRAQMEHARGVSQAAAYAPGPGKDASGDVYMNSVEAAATEPSDGGLAWALANAMEQGDWSQAESLQVAILAVKGGGKGGFRKGLGKGKSGAASSPAAAAKGGGAGAGFQGNCNHCGNWGHRRSECRKLDQELKQKGGAKGDKGAGKGGKGKKGGKGPPADPLMECAADEDGDWAETLDAEGEEWCFDNTISSLAPWTQVPAKAGAGRSGYPRRSSLGGAGKGNPTSTPVRAPVCDSIQHRRTAVHNRFSGLNSLLDDSEVLLSGCNLYAVAGEKRGGRVVEAVVDSGAVHCVTPPGLFPGKVRPSPWSRAGRGYRAANGTGIKNLGQVDVPFATAEGHRCKIPFQVAEVEQPLLSVAHLTSAGNMVQLGDTEGTVVNLATGRTIALERRGGVYIMRMFIADASPPLPFRRQGA